jgi:coenzyme F420-reducing hydrogenase delta subunit
MEFTLENVGSIKKATVTMGDLTIICGNMYKTKYPAPLEILLVPCVPDLEVTLMQLVFQVLKKTVDSVVIVL